MVLNLHGRITEIEAEDMLDETIALVEDLRLARQVRRAQGYGISYSMR